MSKRNWALSVGLCLLAACGGGGGGGGDAAPGCLYSGVGLCAQNWSPPPGAKMDWDATKATCLSNGGTWQTCPAANQAGICTGTFTGGGSMEFVVYTGLVCSSAEGEAFCRDSTSGFSSTYYTPGTAACGPGSQNTVSCDQPADHICSSFDGSMSSERTSVLQGSCAFAGGTAVGACTSANRVATCQYVDVSGLTVLATYYVGADILGARSDCTDAAGTWTPY